MVERFERFICAISEVSRLWHKIATDEMVQYGLKGAHAIYLVAMYRLKDGVTAAQLCEVCAKDKSDVSRAMSLMEKQGIIMREGVGKNLYRARLTLTEKGKAAAEQVRARAAVAVEMAGKNLTDANRNIFYESLDLITNNLREVSKKGLDSLN